MKQTSLFVQGIVPGTYEPTEAKQQMTLTSFDAGKSIKGSKRDIEEKILALLSTKPMTADECSELLGVRVTYGRPRFTDLKKAGLIEPTGEKRLNETGKRADVMRVVK